ncbi:MAG: ABC transporter ATP-binding protein, partial [Hyphomicrobiales bacterium]|nr:ABC transporter ATP-binding protein [Hyphomicrobiales bacterium]
MQVSRGIGGPVPGTQAGENGPEQGLLRYRRFGPFLHVGLNARVRVATLSRCRGWARSLGRARQYVHAVENVSFNLAEGETLSIVGESGCGKSTIARSLLRLVEPVSGTAHLAGEDILAMDRPALNAARQRMPMVSQDPLSSLNPRMRTGEALMEPIIVHGLAGRSEARDRAADLMTRVGLSPDMLDRFPHEYSGGQRQRICIARALSLQPKLLIADEAVSALDVRVKAQVANLLMKLQEELGLAMLFISHDMAVVERISHRVAVMYLGEIVEVGPRAAV